MARRRTPLPDGFYIVQRDGENYTPYHQVDDMMFYAGAASGALVPIGPGFSSYLLAARFIYERAGIPWEHRKRVTGGASSQTTDTRDASERQSPAPDAGGVLPDKMAKRSRAGASQKRDRGRNTRSVSS